jgi:hypothetical protein
MESNNTMLTQQVHPSQRKIRRSLQLHITKQPKPNDEWGASISAIDQKSTKIYFQNINRLQESKTYSR